MSAIKIVHLELSCDDPPIDVMADQAAFRRVFRAQRSERKTVHQNLVQELVARIDSGESDGIEFSPEDPLPLPDHDPSPVTLEELQEAIVDRFAVTLDEPERPVTWDPTRASRDPDAWMALGTFVHPRLDRVLSQRAGAGLPDTFALVVSSTSHDEQVAAVRADRSPPELIRRLVEIDQLGPPLARGDAEALASKMAAETGAKPREYERSFTVLQQRQSADSLQQRFLALVHDTLAAGCAATRYDGVPGADPITVWHELGADGTSPWSYARAFQDRLGIPLAQVVPGRLQDLFEPIAPEPWSKIRHSSGTQLRHLISEFQRMCVVPHNSRRIRGRSDERPRRRLRSATTTLRTRSRLCPDLLLMPKTRQ